MSILRTQTYYTFYTFYTLTLLTVLSSLVGILKVPAFAQTHPSSHYTSKKQLKSLLKEERKLRRQAIRLRKKQGEEKPQIPLNSLNHIKMKPGTHFLSTDFSIVNLPGIQFQNSQFGGPDSYYIVKFPKNLSGAQFKQVTLFGPTRLGLLAFKNLTDSLLEGITASTGFPTFSGDQLIKAELVLDHSHLEGAQIKDIDATFITINGAYFDQNTQVDLNTLHKFRLGHRSRSSYFYYNGEKYFDPAILLEKLIIQNPTYAEVNLNGPISLSRKDSCPEQLYFNGLHDFD
jgi:uncharacterized protein YjbI with pentapeptide repeats